MRGRVIGNCTQPRHLIYVSPSPAPAPNERNTGEQIAMCGVAHGTGTYRFQIAVYDILLEEEPQALDDGVGEAPDQAQTEALVVVLFDQFVQVDAADRKCDMNEI